MVTQGRFLDSKSGNLVLSFLHCLTKLGKREMHRFIKNPAEVFLNFTKLFILNLHMSIYLCIYIIYYKTFLF